MQTPVSLQTDGGLILHRRDSAAQQCDFEEMIASLDNQLGLIFASTYEYPSRYSLWDMGLVNPPLRLTGRGGDFVIEALNARGRVLAKFCHAVLAPEKFCRISGLHNGRFEGTVLAGQSGEDMPETQRTRRVSIFSVVRALWRAIACDGEENFGLYGAFGYDLIFQIEDLQKKVARASNQRDLVLYMPDYFYISDNVSSSRRIIQYDFEFDGESTSAIPRDNVIDPFRPSKTTTASSCDHAPGAFSKIVEKAKKQFACGNLYEVVPGQTFSRNLAVEPSTIFKRLRKVSPSPYSFFINLGENEFLVGASPEMFVRTTGARVETCPISGTIRRGADSIEDARQIQTLLNSSKDEAELTMCTDVDRNDKSRICVPGSINVIGRRQIEIYSHVIHTVDHVEGTLKPEFDGLDAFITHMWAVTVTGAPKLWAINFLEDNERTARNWYGGAVGLFRADGDVNTGLSIRLIQIKDGVARVRAGATLLYYSDAEAEERETEIKAAALLHVLDESAYKDASKANKDVADQAHKNLNILLVDHDDSFVHTLSSYLAETGATVSTYRYSSALKHINKSKDLIVMSPGPGRPGDFETAKILSKAIEAGVPVFGVCLGLQAITEYFGGGLSQLAEPKHGVPGTVTHCGEALFEGLPQTIQVGRYHSLYADKKKLPDELTVTAQTADGVIMGVQHKHLPVWGVQFHPESILSEEHGAGRKLIVNLLDAVSAIRG